MTEQQWIARARHGDADAFEQLVVAYEGPVYRLALRMCGSAEDAREVAQDAFLAAWRGLPAFRGDSRFSSWLYEIAQALSLESGTVKSRISRARRQLREILLRQGNFFSDSAVLPNRKEG